MRSAACGTGRGRRRPPRARPRAPRAAQALRVHPAPRWPAPETMPKSYRPYAALPQRLAQQLARRVQTGLYGLLGHAQHLADLLIREVVEVPQHDHLAIVDR